MTVFSHSTVMGTENADQHRGRQESRDRRQTTNREIRRLSAYRGFLIYLLAHTHTDFLLGVISHSIRWQGEFICFQQLCAPEWAKRHCAYCLAFFPGLCTLMHHLLVPFTLRPRLWRHSPTARICFSNSYLGSGCDRFSGVRIHPANHSELLKPD
jgi:hypothetical protein